MGTRNNGLVGEPTKLQFQFLKNSEPFNPFMVEKVTIHATHAEAEADTDILFELTSTGITSLGDGLFEYDVPMQTSTGTYYDKIFILPTSTGIMKSFINIYYLEDVSYSGDVILPTCKVFGYLVDARGRVMESVPLKFIPDVIPSIEVSTLSGVVPTSATVVTDTNGYFEINLIRTVEYRIAIRSLGLYKAIRVPNANSAKLWSLVSIPVVGEPVEDGSTPPSEDW